MNKDPYEVLGVSRNSSDEEINAAYDAIKNGTADSYGSSYGGQGASGSQYGYQSSGGGYSSSYSNPFTNGWGFNWNDSEGYGSSYSRQQSYERTEYTAARNYIRNGAYREALNALNQVPESERDGRWYYLNACANMYAGNRINAMNAAQRACEIDPGNEEYRTLLTRLQSGGDFYDSYSSNVFRGGSFDINKVCLYTCAANVCLNAFCGGRFCCI